MKAGNKPPQPGGFPGGQNQNQCQPLQQVQNHRKEQNVIKKEDIPKQVNSAPNEVKRVEVDCVAPYDEHRWVIIDEEKDGMKTRYVHYVQALKPRYHLASFLNMAGNSLKGISATDKNTMVFVVMQCEVTVVLSTSQFVVSRGDSFFMPPLNTYNILNMKSKMVLGICDESVLFLTICLPV